MGEVCDWGRELQRGKKRRTELHYMKLNKEVTYGNKNVNYKDGII